MVVDHDLIAHSRSIAGPGAGGVAEALLGDIHHAERSWFRYFLDGHEVVGIHWLGEFVVAGGDTHGMCDVGAVVADLAPIRLEATNLEEAKLMNMKVNALPMSHH